MSRSHEGEYRGRTRHRGGRHGLSVVRHPRDDLRAAPGLVAESPGVVQQHLRRPSDEPHPQLGMLG